MTEIWIQFMDYAGCNPKNQNIFKKIINIFYAICCVCIILLSMVELILTKDISLSFFTKIVIIVVGYFQVCIDYYYRLLLESNNKFYFLYLIIYTQFNFSLCSTTSVKSYWFLKHNKFVQIHLS